LFAAVLIAEGCNEGTGGALIGRQGSMIGSGLLAPSIVIRKNTSASGEFKACDWPNWAAGSGAVLTMKASV